MINKKQAKKKSIFLTIVACHARTNKLDETTRIWVDSLIDISRYTLIVFDNKIVHNIPINWNLQCVHTLISHHGEYDFGSYKRGLDLAKKFHWLEKATHIILTNDSIIGPVSDLKSFFDKLLTRDDDVSSITESQQIYPHLQSFFFLIKASVFKNESVQSFFNEIKKQKSRFDVIQKYEIGFSQLLIKQNFKIGSFFPRENCVSPFNGQNMGNPTAFPSTLVSAGVPIIKRKCIYDPLSNQEGILSLQRELFIRNKSLWKAVATDESQRTALTVRAQSVAIVLSNSNIDDIPRWLCFLDTLYQYNLQLIVPLERTERLKKALAARRYSDKISADLLRILLFDFSFLSLSHATIFQACAHHTDAQWLCYDDSVFLDNPAIFVGRIHMAAMHPTAPTIGDQPCFYLRSYLQTSSPTN